MFQIDHHPSIISHIKLKLRIFQKEGSGWFSTFCPYCSDMTRKSNPSHGHFHISPTFPFGHCFRCGVKAGLDKFLLDTGFTNQDIISKIKSVSGFTYGRSSKLNVHHDSKELYEKIKEQYMWIRMNYPEKLNSFLEYIYTRCLDINPSRYLIVPAIKDKSILQIKFLNYSGELCVTRNIDSGHRFEQRGSKKYYYFQNLMNIDEYPSIVLCEGGFDLINLYNYNFRFKESFFISIGGNNYKGAVDNIINTFLLIGKYVFYIIFDNGLKFQDRIINSIMKSSNLLNPNIKFEFYAPIVGKDVSDIMLLQKL